MSIINSLNSGQLLNKSSSVSFADLLLSNGGALRTDVNASDTLKIQAYDVDGTTYQSFLTLTAGNTPTLTINADITADAGVDIDMVAGDHAIGASIGANTLSLAGATSVVDILGGLKVGSSAVTIDDVLDEDNMASDSATAVATQQSIKTYVDNKVVSSVDYIGGYNASTNAPDLDVSPSGVSKGDMYTVTAAGTFFTTAVEVGDVLIAESDDASTESDWTIVNKNVDAATDTTPGIVELATTAEVNTGTDSTRAITASAFANSTKIGYLNQDVTTTAEPTFAGLISTGDFDFTGQAVDIDLVDNNTSALSFDASDKSGILELVTTDGSEGVKLSGYLNIGDSTAVTSILDEDDLSSDSATALATQQSIKAYVTTQVAASDSVSEVTGTTQSMSVNTRYIANNASLVTLTLPATASIGDRISVRWKGAGGWKIAQNASQDIQGGNLVTTTGTGGYLQSTDSGDTIDLECITANNNWLVVANQGNITSA